MPGLGRRVGLVVAIVSLITHLAVLGFGGWALANPMLVRDMLVVGKVADTTHLDEFVSVTGMSSAGRFYLFAAHPTLHTPESFAEACPVRELGIAVLGCYSSSTDTIHLLDITDDSLTTLEPVVAAHEMLHAVWARFNSSERAVATTEVERSFASISDPDLLVRLAPFQSMSRETRAPELFAIFGTESLEVTSELEAIYGRFFDDRAACVRLAKSSTTVIATIVSGVESVATQLVSSERVIDKKYAAYRRDRKELSRDIAVFNKRANTRGFYSSSSAFAADRRELVARSSRLEFHRRAINRLIDRYNGLVNQMAVLNAQALSLNQALGVDASAMEPIPVTTP